MKQLEDKKINNNNIGITILAFNEKEEETLPQAYIEPDKIVDALSSIIEGIDLRVEYKNFIPPRAHPEFKSVTIWSINNDAYYNYKMAETIHNYLKNIE
ncbi:MAG: hypothetical protein IJ223_00120 [Clostridia bacterium]|nr:hypothetical protein [Clostridia bacterium]